MKLEWLLRRLELSSSWADGPPSGAHGSHGVCQNRRRGSHARAAASWWVSVAWRFSSGSGC